MKNFTSWDLPKKPFLSIGQKWVFYFFVFFLFPVFSSAGRVYPDMSVTISSGGSDYLITFSYSGAGVVGCSESVKHDFDIFKNNDHTSIHKISGSGSRSSGSFTYVAGPGNSGYFGLRYKEWEDCGWAWCNCVEWAWSGYPRATSSTERAGWSVST